MVQICEKLKFPLKHSNTFLFNYLPVYVQLVFFPLESYIGIYAGGFQTMSRWSKVTCPYPQALSKCRQKGLDKRLRL